MANAVVAHFTDGRLVKGTSLNVDPARPICHIRTSERDMVEIRLAELKALFFVKHLDGKPTHQRAAVVEPWDLRRRGTRPIEVQFQDGERIVGLTTRYPPVRPFFYIMPADVASNNARILVNRAAVVAVRQPDQGALK